MPADIGLDVETAVLFGDHRNVFLRDAELLQRIGVTLGGAAGRNVDLGTGGVHSLLAYVTPGLPADIVVGIKWLSKVGAKIDTKVKDVAVRTVGVYHDDALGAERGLNTVFLFEVGGLRIAHLGDLGHKLTKAQLNKIGKVDILMIPVGGVYTINGGEAKEVVEQLKPKMYIIPMHYGTPVYDDLLPPTEFLEDQKNVKKFTTNVLAIDPKATPPTSPIIAVLHYDEK